MSHSELQESPESRLLGAGYSRQLGLWVTPDGQRALSTEDAIAALDGGEIGHVTFPFAANVRALPDELVDRICHPPAPSPPAWLDSLAELVAEQLKPVIRSEVRAALRGKS